VVAAVCGLLLLAVIAVFGQTAGHDFVNFDDDHYVYENRHVLEGLTGAETVWAFTDTHLSGHWHPLTWLSLMADAQVLAPGEGPLGRARLAAGMHLVNLALHAANAVLLFLVLRAMTASTWPSALVAAIFAVHPLHVESVAWITERKDVLSGLFGLLALGAYAWYARGPSVVRYLLVAAALSLGLMAKPVLVTWPLVFLLLDYWPLGRFSQRRVGGARKSSSDGALREPAQNTDERFQGSDSVRDPPVSPGRGQRLSDKPPSPACRRVPCTHGRQDGRGAGGEGGLQSRVALIVEKIPLLLLVAASAAVTFVAQRSSGTVISLQSVPISERIARAAVLYVVYLGKSLWPVNLAALYPQGPAESIWPALGAGILLALLTAGALWGAWRGQRWLAVGWFWYLGILLPTVGLVQVGLQVMADRFLYLPQIGLCMALVWGAHWGVERLCGHWPSRRWLDGVGGALLVAGLMACAWQQTSYWRNSERLWTRALTCTSNNGVAHNNLGGALVGRGQVEEAMAHFRKALEIKPDYTGAHYNLGKALAGRGQFDEAIAHYRKALEIEPDYVEAHYNLGNALANRGQVEEAIAQYRKALEIKPDYAEAHSNLGVALAGRGKFEEAIARYRQALEIKPDDADAHNNLGLALTGRGQVEEAIAHYRKALEIKPDGVDARNNLGLALAGRGQVEEAIAHYRKALEIKPDDVKTHINFGAALAGCGRLDEAIAHFRKVLEIKPDYAVAHNNLGLALAGRGQVDEAIAHYRKALEIKPDYADAHVNLGDALAGHGQVEEALAHYRKALDLARRQNQPALAASIQAQIRLYDARRPFHGSPRPPTETSIQP
jgi:tetratricopeptide (TPR) repeat protein